MLCLQNCFKSINIKNHKNNNCNQNRKKSKNIANRFKGKTISLYEELTNRRKYQNSYSNTYEKLNLNNKNIEIESMKSYLIH